MARKSFKEQAVDFSAGLLNKKPSDNLTDDIVETLDKTSNKGFEILYGDPDIFIPYHDEKLRLPLRQGEERDRLVESIKQNGVLDAINVITASDGKYEVLQGHNRIEICKELGLKVPYIVRDDLPEDSQTLVVIDSNILNRQNKDIPPSQFSYILKKKYDAERNQGTFGNGFQKCRPDEKVGEEYGLSGKMIRIYVKINSLTEIAKKSLDSGEITLRSAYQLAFMPEDVQNLIINLLGEYIVNEKNLKALKDDLSGKIFESKEEMTNFVEAHLAEKERKPRKFDYRNVQKYIPKEIGETDIEDYIIKAIKAYRGY